MREVRWVLQASRPGTDVWVDQNDRVYGGWFHSTGNNEPGPAVVAAFEKAERELTWLDVRLVQDTRSFQTSVLKEVRREKEDDASRSEEQTRQSSP